MFALDLLNQFQSYNGTLLAAGKIYVYHLGRTHLAPVYGDHNGATVLPNPVILDDQGMAEIYLNDAFNYTVVVCDAYGAEQFSRDIFPRRMGDGESIGTQLYEGISPICVNNDVFAISADTSRLGVVEPLYFVKDDEEETIIGFSGEAIIPSGTMNESALGFENNKITGYNGSAFSAGNEYEAGANIDITDGVISGKDWSNEINDASANAYDQSTAWTDSQGYLTGVDLSEYAKTDFVVSSIDAATSGKYDTSSFSAISGSFLTAIPSEYVTEDTLQSGLSSKLDSTAFSTVSGNFLTGLPSDLVYTADITGLATTAQLDEKLNKSESANFYPMTGNPSGFLTAHQSLPQSANWNSTYNTVHDNSASWTGGTANPQIPVTSTSGISIFESGDKVYFNISADYTTKDWVTGQGYLTAETDWTDTITGASAYAYEQATAAIPAPFDPTYISGQIDSKLDSATYAADSGNFATTGDINDLVTSIAETYQSTAGMTAYMSTADSANFYTTANESGFITGIPESATWNSTTETVSSNSASWGQGGTIASPSGTILVDGYNIEASNSAMLTSHVSSDLGPVITDRSNFGPSAYGTCHITEIPDTPHTYLILASNWIDHNFEVIYSSNGGVTGSFITRTGAGDYTIPAQNSTEVAIFTNSEYYWVEINNVRALISYTASDIIELAPLSALPTYNYALNNAITGINGSAIGGITYTTGSI